MYKPVPSKVDFPTQERDILRFWEEHRIFEKLVARNRGGPRYSFFDGPITANNPMGVHHAWGRTYKDIYQRYKAMQGFDQRYQNGFDCQGLWVEVEVERDLGLNSKRQIEEYGLERFVEQCRQRVLTYADTITQQSIRLGQWMDWAHSYYTMSDTNIEHIWSFLKRCHENGWLYKGWRTMPWCARCGTSLSQHELIGTDSYRDVDHPSLYVRLPIRGQEGESFLVWTTTPWTLGANVALAVHPDLDYARVRADGEVFYLSAKTLSAIQGPYQVLGTLKGRALVGWHYRGPFAELEPQQGVEHRVVPWDEVGDDEGTGIVHIAPGCGVEDFALGQEQGLPVLVPIDEDGAFLPGYGPLSGLTAWNATETIYGSLQEKGLLYRHGRIEHRYPTCWRCGEEIVFRGVSEWFIACEEIRPRMLEAAQTVEWTPPSVGKRMEDWLHNMGDWCVSRKRYWGLPLPFYSCPQCSHFTVVGSIEELRALAVSGLDQLQELHRPWIDAVRIRCPQCGAEVERIPEVGDCWLDAGIVPFSTIGPGSLHDRQEWSRWYPADWISEMREQVRLWFYSMLFMSVTLEGRAPYQRVLSYEKLMDEHGRPMHKSAGNAIWFDEAAERMGADVMRWLYAAQNLQRNLCFGYGPAEEVHRKLLTLWNVYSFFVTYAEATNFDPSRAPEVQSSELQRPSRPTDATVNNIFLRRPARAQPSPMDRWILGQLDALVSIANQRLEAYDAAGVVQAVDNFVDDLSNWYVRRGRRRFLSAAEPGDRLAAFTTLYECLVTLARLIAPFMPLLAEEIYQNLVRGGPGPRPMGEASKSSPQGFGPVGSDASAPESVHLTPYPTVEANRTDEALNREMDLARAIVLLGRAARNEAGIPVRQPLPAIAVAGALSDLRLSEAVLVEVRDELNVKEVRVADDVGQLARRVVRPNARVLGPKLGRRFPEVQRALEAGAYDLEADGTVAVAGEKLSPDEVTISLEPLENQTLVHQAGPGAGGDTQAAGPLMAVGPADPYRGPALAAALDRTITPELAAEGLARELVHRVQLLRRDAGLSVRDRIVLGVEGGPEVESALGHHGSHIQEEVGATEIRLAAAVGDHRWQGEIDGLAVVLSLERVS